MVRDGCYLSALAGLAMLLLAGCQAAPPLGDHRDRLPPPDAATHPDRPSSLVFDGPALSAARDRLPPVSTGWHHWRNDARLSTEAGWRGATVESEVTWTWDRQWQSGGRVYDSHHQSTYRQRVRQTVR